MYLHFGCFNGKCRWIYQSHGSNGMQISLTAVFLVLWPRDETRPKWREFQFLELDSHHDSVRKRSKVIRVRGKWIWLHTNMKTPVEVACLHQKMFINFDHPNNSAGFCLNKNSCQIRSVCWHSPEPSPPLATMSWTINRYLGARDWC